MTLEEFNILCREDVQLAIRENRENDPLKIALSNRIPHPREVATQVKYLHRAAKKLPHYAAAFCLLPPRAFEQSSSEECALNKHLEGDSVLDLTCGLGVDSWALSQRFKHVTCLERDPVLARITAENFRRLGCQNIEVIHSSAEDFLRTTTQHFDWIFADPDRRGEDGKKQVCLEDCSPDILQLYPRIREVAPRLCLKNSPIFDVEEALRLFPDSHIEVVSLRGECKEVMIYDDHQGGKITATALSEGQVTAAADCIKHPTSQKEFHAERYHWLLLPDVALQKARLTAWHLEGVADLWSNHGFGFAEERPTKPILGRIYEIVEAFPYEPRRLKPLFKGHKCEILKRDCPLAIQEVEHRLGLKSGADEKIALTKIGNDYWVFRIK